MYILVKFMNYFLILFMKSNKLGYFWKATHRSSYIIMNYLTIEGNKCKLTVLFTIRMADNSYILRGSYITINMYRG